MSNQEQSAVTTADGYREHLAANGLKPMGKGYEPGAAIIALHSRVVIELASRAAAGDSFTQEQLAQMFGADPNAETLTRETTL